MHCDFIQWNGVVVGRCAFIRMAGELGFELVYWDSWLGDFTRYLTFANAARAVNFGDRCNDLRYWGGAPGIQTIRDLRRGEQIKDEPRIRRPRRRAQRS